jgi:L-iditol 2-dehydrogenase
MKAWVLRGPEEPSLVDKPVPEPGLADVLVRIDAIKGVVQKPVA